MLPWKQRKRQILPVNQNISSVYFSLAKFQLVSCNLSLAMIWQMTYTYKRPKLCSAKLTTCTALWKFFSPLSALVFADCLVRSIWFIFTIDNDCLVKVLRRFKQFLGHNGLQQSTKKTVN